MSVTEQHDDLVERLQAFGRNPVPPAVQSAHLTAMGQVGVADNRKWFGRLRVAGALMVGFLAGSTGLAAAGVEAGPVSAPGEAIAKAAGVEIENGTATHGTARYYGSECVTTTDGKAAKNRGAYLKLVREQGGDMEAAKASKCGMPLNADGEVEETEATGADEPKSPKAEKGAKANKGKSGEKGAGAESGDADAPEGENSSDERNANADCVAENPGNAGGVEGAEDPSTLAPGKPAEDAEPGKPECLEPQGDGAEATGAANGRSAGHKPADAGPPEDVGAGAVDTPDQADAGLANKP